MPNIPRPLVIVLVLAFWVLSGPVGMAFNGCAMMGAMCEAPCGVSSYIAGPLVTAITLQPLITLAAHAAERFSAPALNPLDPPPKSALLSA